MAGAGYKLFATGDVLTAAQVNTYLQEQVVMVFANAAARTTALSGVLAEGMVTYLKDTDALEIYSGAAWVGYGSGDITGITTGATSGLTGGVTSGTADLKLNTTAKGGLLVGTGSGTVTELTVGSNTQVLTADSTTASGLKWATPASSTPTFVGTVLRRSVNQSISNATLTAVAFTQETLDTNGFHDNTTNNTRVTIPSGYAGKYMFIWNQVWTSNSTGYRKASLYLNGASTSQLFSVAAANGDQTSATGTVTFSASVGDYFEVYVIQNSGGNLDMIDNSYFQVIYLGA